MFATVLIANRGEIAVRALRTLKRLGVRSVAVYAEADRTSPHVSGADQAIALDGDKPVDTYLNIDKLIAAAKASGAEAVFPGYGFLAESAEFAEACAAAGIVFIGPSVEQLRAFGLKHRARELAAAAQVPMTPGSGLLDSPEHALAEAARIGYPVMLKSTAGGGGIGLTRCADAVELTAAFASVQRLGAQFFGDGGAFVERCVEHARHIEVQIFGDGHGRVLALGERDCSLQRRNQKVVEETPAPGLPAALRSAMLQAAVQLGEQVGYRSAGTVEFIYDPAREAFYFLEVNTRLQVEHPVTEAVTGLDLIECMLRLAAGDALDWSRMAQPPQGHALEVRLYAEDPLRQFMPSPGTLTEVFFPQEVRVDGWVASGTEVSAHFDPLLAKLIVHGRDRAEALDKMQRALAASRLHGIASNLDYLRQVLAEPRFVAGQAHTRLLDDFSYQAAMVEVLSPGTCSSVQDYPGRLGYWAIGVPPSGPMDDYAFRLGNRIVGNAAEAAGLEFTLQGPSLRWYGDALIALTGAECPAELDGQPVAYWQPVAVKAGQVLTLGRARSGCRTYLAVRNGIDVPQYLGSRSTFALGQFGGHGGRVLRGGDLLAVSQPELAACTTPAPISAPQALDPSLLPEYRDCWEIGVLYGPHGAPDFFSQASIDNFFASEWQVHYNSNRLGVRLSGPAPEWTRADGGEAGLHPSNVHDCEYAIGAINFTGDFPVILTQDGPSLGGFVCPVTVAKAELWKVGQLKPGDRVRFHLISFRQAQSLEQAQLASIQALAAITAVHLPVPALLHADGASAAILAELPASAERPPVVYRQAGDSYVLVEYGDNVMDLALRLRVQLLQQALSAAAIAGVEELAPGVRSLQVRYDSRVLDQRSLLETLLDIEQRLGDVSQAKVPSRILHLPMAFEDSATLGAVSRYRQTVRSEAPWLPNNVDFLQRINGLGSRDEVRDILFSASYLVLGLGDVYLNAPCAVPLDPRHRLLSSKYSPARTFTAEGTVGIGGMYLCIYGMDSPGGYQLVGRTLPIWNTWRKNSQFVDGQPWLLQCFDQIRFYPVSEAELELQREAFREGRAQVRIEHATFDFAAHRQVLAEHAKAIAAFGDRQRAAFNAEVPLWRAVEPAVLPPETPSAPDPATLDGHLVSAEMSGSIWKVLVEDGQWVEAGAPLLVVEAMKMELAITAPVAGRVTALYRAPGQAVQAGDALLLLEPERAA